MSAPQVAVVTGGARGLGEAIVRRLHADGYRVAVADLGGASAEALAKELDGTATTARAFTVDVADRDAPAALLRDVLAAFGAVHVLVNNAARTQATPVMEIGADELDTVMAVNFGGTFRACQVFGAHLAEQGYGRIVNMASLAGQNGGTATGAHYAASKGAVLTATKVFARDLAARGVTVNAVSPGPQDGETVRTVVGEDGIEALRAGIPVGRLGDPAFVARMVALLASPDAASVTGACWDVNGGLYLR
ncbi:SDR family NAD(P)-dependent oxidoreductase [Pseudonocardia halophobica]|uniref:3-oxoacyl-ACP reductase n=1 Tax=Pseudonocardia halophobica TaxID=29401 RepID=A0A9W6P0M0_9PSEU|nr:SDR family oxidoreductase [Pseudonocardia halophobica]GLL15663.1 3-oxoacyl-ACP reductase [Pseudonocardia halophobica]